MREPTAARRTSRAAARRSGGGTGGAATSGSGGTAQGAAPSGGASSGTAGVGGSGDGGGGASGGDAGSDGVGGSAGAGARGGVSGSAGAGMSGSAGSGPTAGKLTVFYLDVGGSVMATDVEDPEARTIVEDAGQGPDGIALDMEHGHIYWTGMGVPANDDGFVMRSNLDGSNVITVIPAGGTYTPKQLRIDHENGKLYWSDREGMRVQRSNLDGYDDRNARHHGNRRDRSARQLRTGASASRSTSPAATSIGARRARTTAWSARSGAPTSPCPLVKTPRTAATSKCSSRVCPSRSTSTSTSRTASSTGPIAATTPSTAPPSKSRTARPQPIEWIAKS